MNSKTLEAKLNWKREPTACEVKANKANQVEPMLFRIESVTESFPHALYRIDVS